MINSTRIAYLIAALTTLAYCIVAWYLGNLFVTLVGEETLRDLPRLSTVLVVPLDMELEFNMIHWQLLGIGSLLIHFYATHRSTSGFSGIHLASHYGVLLLLFFLHLIGFAASFTAVAYTLN